MKMELPTPVLHSLFALNEAGYEAFVVGGCVRDALMGKEPYDWDITTSALPEQTLAVFRDYRTIETGIRHGTVTVILDDTPLEITTYRVDGHYSDGRHPDKVSFTRSLTEDLRRRDFTINAIAYHPSNGLIDPFGGQKDLDAKIIRCVGEPAVRFGEDALRILRGLRFSSTLDFTIHPATAKAMHRLAHTLNQVSAERIAVELLRLLCGTRAPQVLSDYNDIFAVILPDVRFESAAKRVVFDTPLRNLAALLLDLKPATAEMICGHLRLSNQMTKDVVTLVRYHNLSLAPTRTCVLKVLHLLSPNLTSELVYLKTVIDGIDGDAIRNVWDHLIQENDCCYQLKDLAVTGKDLMAFGIQAGPEIGATLNRLLTAVMDGDCPNQKEDLLKLAAKKPAL